VPIHVPKEYSEETARTVDEEVKKILSETHARVTEILGSRRRALDELAMLLLEKEVVERPELQAILKVRSLNSVKERSKAAEVSRLESNSSSFTNAKPDGSGD
jgi:cell division protease FtsH